LPFNKFFFAAFFLLSFSGAFLFAQEEPEQALSSEEDAAVQDAELSQEEKEPEVLYQSFIDSMKKIRLLQIKEDFFTAKHSSESGRQLVNSANGKFMRRFYDKDLRLEKVEYWKQGATASQSQIEKVVEYNAPNASGVYSIFEQNNAEKFESRSFYFSDGRLKSQRKNYFDQDGKLLSFDVVTITYDAAKRTIQERLQKYNSSESGIRLFSDEVHNSKYNGKVLEESSYYKNNVLRVKTIYQDFDKGDYVRTTYFDGGIIVRDFYRDNVKIDTSMKGGGVQ